MTTKEIQTHTYGRYMSRDGRKVHTDTGLGRGYCGVRLVRRVANSTPHTCDRCFDSMAKGERDVELSTAIVQIRWKPEGGK